MEAADRKMASSLNVLLNGNICYQEKSKNADSLEYIPKYFSLPAWMSVYVLY